MKEQSQMSIFIKLFEKMLDLEIDLHEVLLDTIASELVQLKSDDEAEPTKVWSCGEFWWDIRVKAPRIYSYINSLIYQSWDFIEQDLGVGKLPSALKHLPGTQVIWELMEVLSEGTIVSEDIQKGGL